MAEMTPIFLEDADDSKTRYAGSGVPRLLARAAPLAEPAILIAIRPSAALRVYCIRQESCQQRWQVCNVGLLPESLQRKRNRLLQRAARHKIAHINADM
ncbi:MAG: hypothetical protein ACP5MJ_14225, partial [Roseiflexus sp.]